MRKILFILAVAVFFIYLATSAGSTPYDYFTRLANAFLHGKYFLDSNPSWLNELVPLGDNKFAVIYPPAPAIVAIPFVLIFKGFQQQILAHIMGALAALVWGLIVYQKTKHKAKSIWIFLLSAFGNIVWFLSANGSVWYTGQVSAYLFLTLTIYESLNKKRPFLVAAYFGLAFLSRLQIILALPLILYLNKRYIKILLGFLPFGTLYGIYNYFRFGNFFQTGYPLIPGVMNEPWFKNGLFNLRNIPNHLKIIFTSLPIFSKISPFIQPSWGGLAIWITSPVFVYALFTNQREKRVWLSWISIGLIAMVVMSHGSTGFAQFGYRFAVDFYVLIMFLITVYLEKNKLKWHHWLLLFVSILVNAWGVIFIDKLSLVGW